jgi:hypothetical protein
MNERTDALVNGALIALGAASILDNRKVDSAT